MIYIRAHNKGAFQVYPTLVQTLVKVLLFSGALQAACSCAYAVTLEGDVVGLSDGDTVTVLDSTNTQYKVRLAGIDAPEKRQPFGDKSKQNLAALVFGKHVLVEWNKYDRYRRIIGKISISGRDINLAQISAGLAWHYKDYQKDQSPADRLAYARAEDYARASHFGLWREATPIPPWDFRHRGR